MTSGPRELLSYFWAPLCAIGSHEASGRPNAQIAVSVFGASIVPEQPRLLVVLSKTNYTHDLVAASGSLAITLLAEGQAGLLEPLGLRSGRDRDDKLAGLEVARTDRGDPYFPGGTGYAACELIEGYDLGDSTAFLVAVRAREALTGGEPLTWPAARELVGEEFLAEWAAKSRREQAAARAVMRWPR